MSTASTKKPCTIRVNGGVRVLESRVGMSIFAACRAGGLLLPTGCGAQGRCGLCAVRALGDLSEPTDIEREKLGLPDIARGRRLACQAKLAGPAVEISVPDYALEAHEFKATVTGMTTLTHDIRGVSLKLPSGPPRFLFKPGQFVALYGKPYAGHKVGGTRAYSIASSAARAHKLELIVRRVPGGTVTEWVFEHLSEGDEVAFAGPFGDFFLRDSGRPVVMIGGGSGLSPFLPMLDAIARSGKARSTTLFFGAVNLRDLYHVEEFRVFAEANPWFRFVPALSGDETDHDYERGLITDVVERLAGDLADAEAYLCGSPGMIGACQKVLARLHLPADRIYYDRF